MTIEKLTELVKELARQHNELEKRMDDTKPWYSKSSDKLNSDESAHAHHWRRLHERLEAVEEYLGDRVHAIEKRVDALTELIGLASPGDPLANRVAALEARLKEKP